jgi:DNA-binding NarL/FixJ family response regulator
MLLGYGVFYHDFPAALEFGRQARSAGELAGDRFATGFGQMIEGMVLHEQDRHPEALAVARPAFEQAMARLDRFNAAFTRLCEAYCVLFTGDVRRADALAEESVAIARPLGDYFIIGNIISNVAWFKCVTGDLESGRRLVEPIAQSMEDAGLVDVSWMAFALGRLHLCGGDLEGAATWYARGTRFATPTTDNRLVCRALVGLAGALRRLGRDQAARGHVDRAAAIARKLGCHHPLSDALEETAFLTAADDPAGAEDLHHQALAIRVDHGLRPFCADSIDALAGLAARAGRLDPAVRLLAASDRARAVMGYPRAAIDQPDADTTLSAARETLGEDAFQAAWAEGSTLSLEEAVAYARRARGSRDRPATGWGSLTPTEQEVVGLVVEGLTNPEIGARLFMSRATVKTHLSHIYAKLGVANRTELATLAGSRSGRQSPATPP